MRLKIVQIKENNKITSVAPLNRRGKHVTEAGCSGSFDTKLRTEFVNLFTPSQLLEI